MALLKIFFFIKWQSCIPSLLISTFSFNDILQWTRHQCHILNKQCPIKIKFFSMSSAKNNFSMFLSSFCLINHWTVVQGKSAERAIKPFARTSIDCSIHGDVFRVQRIARIHFSLNVVAVVAREVKTTLRSLSSTLCLPIESIRSNFYSQWKETSSFFFRNEQSSPVPGRKVPAISKPCMLTAFV